MLSTNSVLTQYVSTVKAEVNVKAVKQQRLWLLKERVGHLIPRTHARDWDSGKRILVGYSFDLV